MLGEFVVFEIIFKVRGCESAPIDHTLFYTVSSPTRLARNENTGTGVALRKKVKRPTGVILSEAKNLLLPNRFELLQMLRCAQHDMPPRV